jgi:hypothetical protein
MKKSILLSMLFVFCFSFAVFGQDEVADAEVEELSEVPSLDELLERPKGIKVESVDAFSKASFDLYDKVIETRKAGEADGWPDQGIKVARFGKEYLMLVKATVELAMDIKSVPKLKLIPATIRFASAKKAISHSSAHIRYMKEQFTAEQWAEYEGMLVAEDVEEEATTEEPADDGDGK